MEWDEPLRQQLIDGGVEPEDLDKRGLAEDPTGAGPRLFFHHADSPKAGRNRIHLDISATPGRRPSLAAFAIAERSAQMPS